MFNHPLYEELFETELKIGNPFREGLAERNPWQYLALNEMIYNNLFDKYIVTKDKNERTYLCAEMELLETLAESVKWGLEGL